MLVMGVHHSTAKVNPALSPVTALPLLPLVPSLAKPVAKYLDVSPTSGAT